MNVRVLLIALWGCGGGGVEDVDQDGFVATEDCNDRSPTVHPGAEEVPYDGIDQDCDGADLEDVDGDGFAAAEVGGDDCDDADPALHPDAAEIWYDGVDQDCAGDSDYDQDGDGSDASTFGGDDCDDGDPDVGPTDLDQDGWSTCAGDCDDTSADVHPDAPLICNDGIDNDCNHVADCGIFGPSSAHAAAGTIRGDAAGDRLGAGVAAAGDIDGDGLVDLLLTAPGRNETDEHGIAYVIRAPANGNVNVDSAHARIFGHTLNIGAAAASVGDVNGDGLADILVGAPWGIPGGSAAGPQDGAAYLFAAPAGEDLTSNGIALDGEVYQDQAGTSVGSAGDQDADGTVDLFIGAPGADHGAPQGGVVYVMEAPPANVDLADADGAIVGTTAEGGLGTSAANAGDVDGDGIDDLVLGAPGQEVYGEPGAAYLFLGPHRGNRVLAAADATLVGQAGDAAGSAVAAAGDLDGDGTPEWLVGAPGAGAGITYAIDGPTRGTSDLSAAATRLDGVSTGDRAGSSLSAGDLDGDGARDVVVGAPGADAEAGAVTVSYGPVAGVVDLGAADAEIVGEEPGDRFGSSVAVVGDTQGDGFEDLLVGAEGHTLQTGSAYLLFGGVP